jgi:hypothetical protein
MKKIGELVLSKEQMRFLIPRVGKAALATFEQRGLTIREVGIVQGIMTEYRNVTAATVAKLMETGLTASEVSDVIALKEGAETRDLRLSHSQAAKTFVLCGNDLAVTEHFLSVAESYVTAAPTILGKCKRYSSLLHKAENIFGGDIGALSELLTEYGPEEVHQILNGRRLPTGNPIVEELFNRFFEGGSDDFDVEED